MTTIDQSLSSPFPGVTVHAAPTLIQRLGRRVVSRSWSLLRHGIIELHDAAQAGPTERFGDLQDSNALRVRITVHDPEMFAAVLLRGALGGAEAYMEGQWTCDDLPGLIRILLRNRAVLLNMEGGLVRLSRPVLKLMDWVRRNTRAGSRRNIAAHYDLGNDFFAAVLDETMSYSAGIHRTPETSLREASVAKIDRLCRKLRLQPGHHLVEIGTGWGAFAIHAARNYGCRVTTTTISKAQHDLARERIEAAGLGDRISLVMEDYRDLKGCYDRLVSVEMIEAVGHEHMESYFAACARLLKPDGVMALQAITIADQHYERARRDVDFIRRYVFPCSVIPSITSMLISITRATDMRCLHLEDIGPHYVHTLRAWRSNFYRHLDQIRAMGYEESFLRLFEYYLCYCEGGFAERFLSDVQLVLARPGTRLPPLLGEL